MYDLDVERTHNFVAEGLVTHNSIYKFRGPDFRNLLKFEEVLPPGGDKTVIVMEQDMLSSVRHQSPWPNAVIANNVVRAPTEAPLDRAGRG